jgi:hypothetical protein
MKLTYLSQRKSKLNFESEQNAWDIFISAYNSSERVRDVAAKIRAPSKYWVLLPEYKFTSDECNDIGAVIRCRADADEAELISEMVAEIGIDRLRASRVCVDITGFMRPQILQLVRFFQESEIKYFDTIYTEPETYMRGEKTRFSSEHVREVRQVRGFEGIHEIDDDRDVLIVGAGYDHALISHVINSRDNVRNLLWLISLPSLSADMYQESMLRLDKVVQPSQAIADDLIYAPANDPFSVAAELSEKYKELLQQQKITNLYLCPLATKPQALGFALFYLNELVDTAASIIFPFSTSYERETGRRVGRTWCYEVRV